MAWEILLILSIIQGITEFLPISSSAHLILISKFFAQIETGRNFDVSLHFGSLLAVLIYLRKDLFTILLDTISKKRSEKQISVFEINKREYFCRAWCYRIEKLITLNIFTKSNRQRQSFQTFKTGLVWAPEIPVPRIFFQYRDLKSRYPGFFLLQSLVTFWWLVFF